MFKKLIQVSKQTHHLQKVNRSLGQRAYPTVDRFALTNPMRLSTFGAMRCFAAQYSGMESSAFHAGREKMIKAGNHAAGFQPGPDRASFQSSIQIPDFEVGRGQLTGRLEITEEMAKERHPLEYMAEAERHRENPYVAMNERCLLITNFPKGKRITEEYIQQLCAKNGGEKAMVKSIRLKEAMVGGAELSRGSTAYAIVEFELEKSVAPVRRALRKLWVQDRLLKVKTIHDQKDESHKERTVVAHGLPSHLEPAKVAAAFAQFGAVTAVELPTVDRVVEAQLQEKGRPNDYYAKQRQMKADQEYRHAQVVLREAQHIDAEFQHILEQSWGKEKAREAIQKHKDVQSEFTQFDMLDEERVQSFTRVMAGLQTEGLQIEKSKATLGVLLKDVGQLQESQGAAVLSSAGGNVAQHTGAIEGEKERLMETVRYLAKNKESLGEAQLSFMEMFTKQDSTPLPSAQQIGNMDPIHKLQRMTLAEVARAYDYLLGILKGREELIKQRIKSSLQHFGTGERILFESGDFGREQESVPDVLRNILRMDQDAIDQYLGVNEQIAGVNRLKKMPTEEKVYRWLTEDVGDWLLEKNFNSTQLGHAETEEFGHAREKMHTLPPASSTRSAVRAGAAQAAAPAAFRQAQQEKIEADVKRVREETDTPFDEIYHKEKKLVQDIVRVQQLIKSVQEKQPNPAAPALVDPKDLDEDPRFGDVYGSANEDQFIKDKRAQERVEALAAQRELESTDGEHQYKEFEQEKIEDLIASGQINREEFERAKAMSMQNRQTNLGYAFITFSHADEAKFCSLLAGANMFIDMRSIDVLPKGNLDHSELDKSYFMKRLRNESEVADQKQELRDARARLRDFEENMENELPATRKLKDFRSVAQEMIEDPKHKTRRHKSNRRTKRETEELHEKLRAYEAANPGIDVTSLYESEQTEKARLRMHKKAFQSYKDFEFLKAGITKPKKDTQGQAKESDVFEPFNYPGLKDTVSRVLGDGIQGRVARVGTNSMAESSTRRRLGRRFDRYTEQEFLESYLGKDFARAADLDANPDNWTFGFQTPLKELFPDKNEFLRYPKMLEEQERLREFLGMYKQDGKALDPEFRRAQEEQDPAKLIEEHMLKPLAVPHPRDPSRTYLGDLKAAVRALRDRQVRAGKPDELDARAATQLLDRLRAEYAPEDMLAGLSARERRDPERVREVWEARAAALTERATEQEAALADMPSWPTAEDTPELKEWKAKLGAELDLDSITAEALRPNTDFDEGALAEAASAVYRQAAIDAASQYDTAEAKIADEIDNALDAPRGGSENAGPRRRGAGGGGNQQRPRPQRGGKGSNSGAGRQSGPGSGGSQNRGFATKNTKKQGAAKHAKVQPEIETDEMDLEIDQLGGNFGSQERARLSNENLYNLRAAEEAGQLEGADMSRTYRQYQEAADALTAARRRTFDKLREQQLALPEDQRVPHRLDSNGVPRPYTLEMLAKDGGPLPIPAERANEDANAIVRRLNKERAARQAQVLRWDAAEEPDASSSEGPLDATEQPLDPERQAIRDLKSRYLDIFDLKGSEAIPDMTVGEYLATFKDDALAPEVREDQESGMYRYQQTYMDESNLARHQFRTEAEGTARTLEEFQDGNESIYDQYKKQSADPDRKSKFDTLREQSLEQRENAGELRKLYSQAKENFVESPDFEKYFEREAEGQSPYGQRQTKAEEDQVAEDTLRRLQEEEADELEYRKELLARMYGGKLTARQYGVLMHQPENNEKARKEFQRMHDYKQKIQARDEIRIAEEAVEQYRRERVLKGEWTEAESYGLLQQELDAHYEKYPSHRTFEREREEEREFMANLAESRTPATLFEREYYFDEGLGESLNDHVAKLKKESGGAATVETRRDRDGFAIVKLSFAPKFKYNLDELLQLEPDDLDRIQLENEEAILEVLMPGDPKEFMQKLGSMNSQGGMNDGDYLNVEGQKLMEKLMHERLYGKYKDDVEGFKQELTYIQKNCSGKGEPAVSHLPAGLDPSNLSHKALLAAKAASELEGDAERFAWEIQLQLKLRKNKLLQHTKRTEQDYVKATRSESVQFRQQVQTLEQTTALLEQDNEWLLRAGDTKSYTDEDQFDLEKYRDLKSELRRQKEAKEKILKQGFPEFKPYLRL